MKRALLLDANLTIVLLLGTVDRRLVGTHKRAQSYDETDFDLIRNEVDDAKQIFYCPNTMTEVANLLLANRNGKSPPDSRLVDAFREFMTRAVEQVVASSDAARRSEFARLGLTDCVLLELARTGATLFTADIHLALAAADADFDVVNYNHIRDHRPDLR